MSDWLPIHPDNLGALVKAGFPQADTADTRIAGAWVHVERPTFLAWTHTCELWLAHAGAPPVRLHTDEEGSPFEWRPESLTTLLMRLGWTPRAGS